MTVEIVGMVKIFEEKIVYVCAHTHDHIHTSSDTEGEREGREGEGLGTGMIEFQE